jgi:hypothetical protein
MDTKVNKTPRQLARDYYDGMLTFDEYRNKRRRLIDDITRPDAMQPVPGVTGTVKDTAPQEPIPAPGTGAKVSQRKYLLPGVAVVLFGVIAGWILLLDERDTEQMTNELSSSRNTAMGTSVAPAVAESVIDSFLATGDWSYEALAGLTLTWSAMQPQEQLAIRTTPAFRLMSDQLRERIMEQRALVDIDGEAAGRKDVLLSLAGHFGIAVTETVPVQAAGTMAIEAPHEPVMQEPVEP